MFPLGTTIDSSYAPHQTANGKVQNLWFITVPGIQLPYCIYDLNNELFDLHLQLEKDGVLDCLKE